MPSKKKATTKKPVKNPLGRGLRELPNIELNTEETEMKEISMEDRSVREVRKPEPTIGLPYVFSTFDRVLKDIYIECVTHPFSVKDELLLNSSLNIIALKINGSNCVYISEVTSKLLKYIKNALNSVIKNEDFNLHMNGGAFKKENSSSVLNYYFSNHYSTFDKIKEILLHGAKKYGRDNWKQCEKPIIFLEAAARHIIAEYPWVNKEGLAIDSDTNKPHVILAITNLLIYSWLINERKYS